MSGEHDADPVFTAAVRAIALGFRDTLPRMTTHIVASAPHLAGHEGCLEGTVLRTLFGTYVDAQAAAWAARTGRPEAECRAKILASEIEAVAAALGIGIHAVPVAAGAAAAPPGPTAH